MSGLFYTYVCIEGLGSVIESKTCQATLDETCANIFLNFKMVVVMRERAKATHMMITCRVLDRTLNNSFCFRSNKWQMQILWIIFYENMFFFLNLHTSHCFIICFRRFWTNWREGVFRESDSRTCIGFQARLLPRFIPVIAFTNTTLVL